jgi:2-amino-4-hydroxy-6-hydroxymethyldihydropteridine diphosphokinase
VAKSSTGAGSNSGRASGPPPPVAVAIALGSNLDDRHAHIAFAVAQLAAVIDDMRVSSLRETDPVGVHPQPRFLNAVVAGRTTLSARALLERLLEIERLRGRTRPYPGAARTLDLDLILYGDAMIHEPGLRVPHPRFRERRFVLEPLAEVAGEWIDPETGRSVAALLAQMR